MKIRSERRHHRRRENFDAYMRSKEKPRQGPGKVQFKNNRMDGSDDKVVISLDMDELKERAADAVVVAKNAPERSVWAAQREAERSIDKVCRVAKDVPLEGSEVWRDGRSSFEFSGIAVAGSILLVVFEKLFWGAMHRKRWGEEEGLGRRVV